MSLKDNPDATIPAGAPQLNLPPGDIRKKQLPLDIPSLLQSLWLLSRLWRLSSPTAERKGVGGAAWKGLWRAGALGALRQGGLSRDHSVSHPLGPETQNVRS